MSNFFWLKNARLLKEFGNWFKNDACEKCRAKCIIKYSKGEDLDFDEDVCVECRKHPVVVKYLKITRGKQK